jgi:hypothetical protein
MSFRDRAAGSRPGALMLALVVLLGAAAAQSQTPPACGSSEHAQFDFWIGEWEVHTADGKLAGHNRIEKLHGGCVLREHYSTPGGYSGESLNLYDARRGRWHQSWADSSGLLLLLDGGLVEGSMQLQGEVPGREGAAVQHRITWTPLEDGRVRQHWQSRSGEGEWSTAFDGVYSRLGSTAEKSDDAQD